MKYRRYAEYKDSGVEWLGEVPAHWSVAPIKRVASSNDDVLAENTPDDYEIEYLEISGVDETKGIVATETLLFKNAPSRARRLVKDGDIVVSTVRTYLKAIAAIVCPPSNFVVSTGFAVIRPKDELTPRFASHLFKAAYLVDEVIANSVGVSYPAINASELVRLPVPIPPLQEQQAVATFLDRETAKIDVLIAKQEQLIAALQEKRQALISHAVTKGLNPDAPMKDSGVEWLGEVPAHWTLVRVGHISRVVRGQTPRPAGDPKFFDGDYMPWITVGEVTKDDSMYLDRTQTMLTELGVEHSRIFESGTLVLSNSGATLGIPKILRLTGCMNDGNAAFLDVERNISIKYLYFYFLAITAYLRGYSQGMGQPNLNTTIIGGLILPKPSLAEQHQIVEHCVEQSATVDILITKIQGVKTQLLERRAALISAAVTGKIDVTR